MCRYELSVITFVLPDKNRSYLKTTILVYFTFLTVPNYVAEVVNK